MGFWFGAVLGFVAGVLTVTAAGYILLTKKFRLF
jgi:hypothetical protein